MPYKFATTKVVVMDLEELGLTELESRAYEALVKLGTAPASEVSSVGDVPYGRVYDVLDGLVAEGLVRVMPGRPKQYSLADPDVLEDRVEERMEKLRSLQEELEDARAMYSEEADRPVWISKGKKGCHKIANEKPEPEGVEYSIKYTSQFHPMWVRKARQAEERGVDFRVLTRYDEETKEDVDRWLEVTDSIRQIDSNEGVAMGIIDDDYMFVGMINSNTNMVIRDEAFIALMKDLFRAKWGEAEKIDG